MNKLRIGAVIYNPKVTVIWGIGGGWMYIGEV